MDSAHFIKLFPPIPKTDKGRDIVYFDNAATSRRPIKVVEAQMDAAVNSNANIHRAVHSLAAQATDLYEGARDAVRRFINAASREEIIFTAGATSALNLVAYSFCERFVNVRDEIVVGEAEHHSNLVPWQLAAARRGAKVVYLRCSEDGSYNPETLDSLINGKTRLVCVGHASNVLGLLNPVRQMAAICHAKGVKILVDGAQGVVHSLVDVQELGCDFYAFSAHKLYGPTGVGVLYGRKELLDEMPPFLSGGEMVGTVSLEGTDFAPLPMKFEAGTQNFNSVAALVPALETASLALRDTQLVSELEATKDWLCDALLSISGLHLYGANCPEKLPIFSFTVDGVHHEDLAILLDKMGISVRSGQMCAEPLMSHFGVTGMLRASLAPYNTRKEAEFFVECLQKAISMLK